MNNNDRSSYLLSGGGRFINGVEAIQEIPKLEIVYLKLNWQELQK